MVDIQRYRFWPLLSVLVFAWSMISADISQARTDNLQGRRVALVVGNSNYDAVYNLKNATNDAVSIAAVLNRLGFEVIEQIDTTRAEFKESLKQFSAAAQGAEAAVFYYSGHGFQLGGSNFLVPVDAKLNDRKTLLDETFRLNDVIEAVQDRNRQTLIFLDACRNNPLPPSVRDESMLDGLAQLDAGTGTFVAFATQPGNITRDGAGDNSPFAAALIKHMETPGISISDMMIRVRNSVEVATLQTQTPWDQSSLRNQFYFSPEEETTSELTEEDKELLLSLNPALRKKFEARFGLKIEASEENEDGEVVAKVTAVKRTLLIQSGQPEQTEQPVQETAPKVVVEEKKKPALKGRFKIASGGPTTETSGPPVIIARLEPKAKKATSQTRSVTPTTQTRKIRKIKLGSPPTPKTENRVKNKEVASLAPSEVTPKVTQRVKTQKTKVAKPQKIDSAKKPHNEAEKKPVTRTVKSVQATPERTSLKAAKVAPKRLVGKEVKPASTRKKVAKAEDLSQRTVAPVGLSDEPEEKTQLASLQPNNAGDNGVQARQNKIKPAKEKSITPPSHALEVQTELKRLGCYRSKIDGLWGANSARALLRYYGNKRIEPSSLDPTSEMLAMLRSEEVVVCKRTIKVIKKKRKKARTAKRTSSSSKKAKRTVRKKQSVSKRSKKSASSRRNKLKKGLSGGVFR